MKLLHLARVSSLIFTVCASSDLAVAAPQASPPQGWLVGAGADGALRALSLPQRRFQTLRAMSPLFDHTDTPRVISWDISPNGRQIAFCTVPSDGDFFSARMVRSYLFLQNYNEKETRLLVAAYPQFPILGAVYLNDFSNIEDVSFDFSGRLLVINGGEPEEAYQSYTQRIGFFDWKRRRLQPQPWLVAAPAATPTPVPDNMVGRSQTQSVLSRDGRTMVCIEVSGLQGEAWLYYQGKANFNHELIVIDAKTQARRVLLSTPDNLSRPRLSFDGRYCVFSRGARANGQKFPDPLGQIWRADLQSGELKALTSPQGESDNWPDWSPDGHFITWQRENFAEKNAARRYKTCVMNAVGSAARPVAWSRGQSGLRWVAQLPNWKQFARFPIQSLTKKPHARKVKL